MITVEEAFAPTRSVYQCGNVRTGGDLCVCSFVGADESPELQADRSTYSS